MTQPLSPNLVWIRATSGRLFCTMSLYLSDRKGPSTASRYSSSPDYLETQPTIIWTRRSRSSSPKFTSLVCWCGGKRLLDHGLPRLIDKDCNDPILMCYQIQKSSTKC
ncbi:hypothetical protein WDU94_000832 [Cyamophila willieti]